ncbi:MAG: AmmeMemoRadiSam system radical SAM enzyme [Candidatus Omnitrophota bacterium]
MSITPKKALLWEKTANGRIHCSLCAHNCVIEADGFGVCGMRQNINGTLYTYAYGAITSNNIDPIEKKPLYHFLPGTYAYSVATIGCNFKCSFCQNWRISQASVKNGGSTGYKMPPCEITGSAFKNSCSSIAYTYTEPTVFFEYALDTAKLAREKKLRNIFVTNGYMTEEAIKLISPYLDAANVDLKFYKDESYRKICGGRLQPVLDSIRNLKKNGIWVEITTLIIPGENDSDEDLRGIARFIADTGKEIPWHISKYHPDYKYTHHISTPAETLNRAYETGRSEGLKHVYMGNVYARNETLCPGCGKVLIDRADHTARIYPNRFEKGKCLNCNTHIDGVWE